jgi:hypothetical protein
LRWLNPARAEISMRRKNESDDYAFLAIKVSKCEVAVGESINVHLRTTVPYSWDDSDPVIAPDFRLTIAGTCTYPEHRARDYYEITIYGEKIAREQLTFKQIRVRDEYDVPTWPVVTNILCSSYPLGWQPWNDCVERESGAHVCGSRPDTVSRMLTLLGSGRALYVSIHEHKIERQRWVQDFCAPDNQPGRRVSIGPRHLAEKAWIT